MGEAQFRRIGATGHSIEEREPDDFYATEPKAMELLLEQEKFAPNVWECACGQGHLARVLTDSGYTVKATDIIDRGYGEQQDFLTATEFDGDIITNPPYKYALEFVEKALEIVKPGNKVAMFLKIQFLEGKRRRKFFDDFPPKTVYISSSRLNCAKNGDFEKYTSSATAYAWFVWEKGYKDYPVIKFIN